MCDCAHMYCGVHVCCVCVHVFTHLCMSACVCYVCVSTYMFVFLYACLSVACMRYLHTSYEPRAPGPSVLSVWV